MTQPQYVAARCCRKCNNDAFESQPDPRRKQLYDFRRFSSIVAKGSPQGACISPADFARQFACRAVHKINRRLKCQKLQNSLLFSASSALWPLVPRKPKKLLSWSRFRPSRPTQNTELSVGQAIGPVPQQACQTWPMPRVPCRTGVGSFHAKTIPEPLTVWNSAIGFVRDMRIGLPCVNRILFQRRFLCSSRVVFSHLSEWFQWLRPVRKPLRHPHPSWPSRFSTNWVSRPGNAPTVTFTAPSDRHANHQANVRPTMALPSAMSAVFHARRLRLAGKTAAVITPRVPPLRQAGIFSARPGGAGVSDCFRPIAAESLRAGNEHGLRHPCPERAVSC